MARWGEHRPHCGAVAPEASVNLILLRLAGSPCVLPRGHAGPTFHVYGTPGSLEELFQRRRSVVLKIEPV